MMYKGKISTQNVNLMLLNISAAFNICLCGLMNGQSTKLACQEVIGFTLALIGTFYQAGVKVI